jgi:probable F420-dependent oxidoreductase
MKIGAIFPHLEIGADPAVIRDWAQTAEALGYSHLLAYDHVIGAVHENRDPPLWGPYTEQSAFHEPMVLFGYFAACTSRVELVTGILILPQRQTVLAAKQAAEIDVLSGGRLRLGIGTGWNYVEYEALNERFSDRGKRQVEQVELLRTLWSEPLVDYSGEWHRIDRAGLNPLPGRRIPIWFGGFTDVALRRAAALGDGFIFGGSQSDSLEALKKLRRHLAAANRETGSFGIEAMVNYQSGPDGWRRDIEEWQDAGADYVSMRSMALRGMGAGLESPAQHIRALKTYWDVVGDLADPPNGRG